MSDTNKDLDAVMAEIVRPHHAARLILGARRERDKALARVRDLEADCPIEKWACATMALKERIAALTTERDAALARVREMETHEGPKGNGGYTMVHNVLWRQLCERVAQLEADLAARK